MHHRISRADEPHELPSPRQEDLGQKARGHGAPGRVGAGEKGAEVQEDWQSKLAT